MHLFSSATTQKTSLKVGASFVFSMDHFNQRPRFLCPSFFFHRCRKNQVAVTHGICRYGTAPFLTFVVVLSVAVYQTIALIDEMDEFASDFKLADLKLPLGELQDEEQRRRKQVGCVNVCF